MEEKNSDGLLGIASFFCIIVILPIWTICLFKVLDGQALETFRLGTVITSSTALHATYQDVLVSNSLYILVLLGGYLARYLHSRSENVLEEDFRNKYKPKLSFKDRRIAWRQKHFPKKKKYSQE